jgi:hypothetical protein
MKALLLDGASAIVDSAMMKESQQKGAISIALQLVLEFLSQSETPGFLCWPESDKSDVQRKCLFQY